MDPGMTIPHISDVGAFTLKPLFITGSVITTIFLDLAFLSERYLRHKGRLARNATQTDKMMSILSLVFAVIGTLGLILLSILDSYRHSTLHNIFLFCFMGGYIVSAIFICWAYQRLGIRKWIAVNYSMDNTEYYRLPGTPNSSHVILGQAGVHYFGARVRNWYVVTTSVQLISSYSKSFPLGFAVCLGASFSNAGSVFEWLVAFIFTLYIASFYIDLHPAAARHKLFGDVTELQAESNGERS
jgi:hypothetical protein